MQPHSRVRMLPSDAAAPAEDGGPPAGDDDRYLSIGDDAQDREQRCRAWLQEPRASREQEVALDARERSVQEHRGRQRGREVVLGCKSADTTDRNASFRHHRLESGLNERGVRPMQAFEQVCKVPPTRTHRETHARKKLTLGARGALGCRSTRQSRSRSAWRKDSTHDKSTSSVQAKLLRVARRAALFEHAVLNTVAHFTQVIPRPSGCRRASPCPA